MPISGYYKGHGEKVMKSMKKQYGAKKGKSVFYATAAKRGATGSAAFSKADIEKGFKTCYDANDLHKLSYEHEHMGHMMASRKMPGMRNMMKGEEY